MSRWRSLATDAASAPTGVQSPFSGTDAQQGVSARYDPPPPELFNRRHGGSAPAGSVPSVASAPSLLQSDARQHEYSLHGGHRTLASPTSSDDMNRAAAGGDGPRDGAAPGRKRPRPQLAYPSTPEDAQLGGQLSRSATVAVRGSGMPRRYNYGECLATAEHAFTHADLSWKEPTVAGCFWVCPIMSQPWPSMVLHLHDLQTSCLRDALQLASVSTCASYRHAGDPHVS